MIKRTFDLLQRFQENFHKEDVFIAKENGKWVKYSSADYVNLSHNFCYGLMASGLQRGDKIISVTNNRPEWNIADMGIAMAGMVHVPVYTSLSETEYDYIFKHSEAKMVLVSDLKLSKLISPLIKKHPEIKNFYSFNELEDVKNWKEIIELGRKSEVYYKDEVEKLKKEISEEDFATLIYTSGTTGTCKGVMLSHKNLVRNFLAATKVFQLTENDKYLSILPLCHVGGRLGNYQTQYSGSTIIYAENMGTIAANMKEIQVDGFDTVPRILEKIFDTILEKGSKLTGFKKKIFFWAVNLGLKYKAFGANGWFYEQKLKIAYKLVFSKWMEAIGGKVRLAGCGGASLNPRIERIFWACGVKVINMYGLTETSPIITINHTSPDKLMLGTTGTVIDGVEVKIAHDGEILCKGHNVMLGYYKDPDLTASVIDEDGWFHTGDIGELVDGKFLRITDRKKEMFKLSSGKYIAPQVIENKFKESILIDQIMVIGEHEKFASALISPNFKYIKDLCIAHQIKFTNEDDLLKNDFVLKLFSKEIMQINKELTDFEQIKRYNIVPHEWTPVSGELSPTLKLRRSYINNRYQELISSIYSKQTV